MGGRGSTCQPKPRGARVDRAHPGAPRITGMQGDAWKICPRCGEEFVPTAERCGDCGVALVLEGEAQALAAAAPEEESPAHDDLADAEDLVPLREAEIAWARRLGDALRAARVPHRVTPLAGAERGVQAQWSGRWAVLVRREDLERAMHVDAERLRAEMPALEGGELVVRAADEAGDEGGPCPGCGFELAADAEECPECGLVFG